MNANQKFVLALIGSVLVFCLGCGFLATMNNAYRTFAPVDTQAPAPIFVAPTSGPAYNGETDMVLDNGFRMYRPDADWIGDDFDPKEYTLPGTISGPAVANLKSHRGSVCGVVKINEGETLVWPGGGAYWRAGSQLALAARWEHHVDEFLADYPECNNVYGSAKDVPNPTK